MIEILTLRLINVTYTNLFHMSYSISKFLTGAAPCNTVSYVKRVVDLTQISINKLIVISLIL